MGVVVGVVITRWNIFDTEEKSGLSAMVGPTVLTLALEQRVTSLSSFQLGFHVGESPVRRWL